MAALQHPLRRREAAEFGPPLRYRPVGLDATRDVHDANAPPTAFAYRTRTMSSPKRPRPKLLRKGRRIVGKVFAVGWGAGFPGEQGD